MGKKSRMLATGLGEKERIEQAINREKKEKEERAKERAEALAGLVALMAQGIEVTDEEKKALYGNAYKPNIPIISRNTPEQVTFAPQKASLSAINKAFISAVRKRKEMEEKTDE